MLRNNIIHVKDELLNHDDNDKTIIGLSLNESAFKNIDSAKNLIGDLAKLLPGHTEYPIMQNCGRSCADCKRKLGRFGISSR
ncbi:MAG: hypothetical protein WC623_15335 [Pedobacter sp.]